MASDELQVGINDDWKRADGLHDSKTCDRSVLGVVVVGPEYGQAFQVCVNKDCDVHWKKERLARERMAARRVGSTPKEDREAERRQDAERRAKEEAARKAWEAAKPAIETAVAKVIGRTKLAGLREIVLAHLDGDYGPKRRPRVEKHLGPAKTPDDVLIHAAFIVALDELDQWDSRETFVKWATKSLGLDVSKILQSQAKEQKPPKAKPAQTPTKGTKPAKPKASKKARAKK